jgi:hypothetical protein
MSKQQLIEQIRQKTRGVPADFLETFDEPTLQQYLNRLTRVMGRRGRDSVWVRDGGAAAVASRGHV